MMEAPSHPHPYYFTIVNDSPAINNFSADYNFAAMGGDSVWHSAPMEEFQNYPGWQPARASKFPHPATGSADRVAFGVRAAPRLHHRAIAFAPQLTAIYQDLIDRFDFAAGYKVSVAPAPY